MTANTLTGPNRLVFVGRHPRTGETIQVMERAIPGYPQAEVMREIERMKGDGLTVQLVPAREAFLEVRR